MPPASNEGACMTPRIQIVGRLPVELNRRVRAAAKQQQVSLNAFLIAALTQAVATPRRPSAKTGA
jgi:predicted HicB family RNase H-like nuclease